MATRQETQNKRRRMRETIAESFRCGQLQVGDSLPTVRDLAREYGLSVNVANEVVQSLVAEGILHARPGIGIVAGNPRPARQGTYLFLLPLGADLEYVASGHMGIMQRGFEVAVAQLGGSCLTLETEQARQYATGGQLPPLAGIFSPHSTSLNGFSYASETPCAYFGDGDRAPSLSLDFDAVRFDDFGGGQQATRHLLDAGYESIAYLGVHAPLDVGTFGWSAEREKGWLLAMAQAGCSCEKLAFHPAHSPCSRWRRGEPSLQGAEQIEAAREAAVPLLAMLHDGQVKAVIAANFFAARALFGILGESGLAPELWPAVVCFDGFDGLDNHVVSALNLPWDEVGKAGAQLLWERNVGRLRGPSVVRLVPMQLIPRLTCRPAWTDVSSLVMPQLEVLNATPSLPPAAV